MAVRSEAVSRTTFGGCTLDDLHRGSKSYVCDTSCLVNLVGKDSNEAEEELKRKVDEIFQNLELQTERKVNNFYIGKTFIEQRRRPNNREKFVKFDPMDPYTWKKNGISSRWGCHKKMEYGRDGLIVLTAVTKDVVPQKCRSKINHEQYALALQQMLLHHYKLKIGDQRLYNETFNSTGLDGRKSIAYAIYVAFTLEELTKDDFENSNMFSKTSQLVEEQTLEIETLRKELSIYKEELLRYTTKHSAQSDISQYLPKLEVVLQPVQEKWEQLGVSLGIDQSVLSSIKSTPGDSTMYMRQLLKKWSMEGGQLQDLEDGLMSIGRKDLISGLVEMMEVSTDTYVTDVQTSESLLMRKRPNQFPEDVPSPKKQIVTSSLSQIVEIEKGSSDVIDIEMSDDKLSVVKMEGDIKSMEISVSKKDVSVQFDYLIPVNDTLYGVHVASKKLFLIQGDSPQSFNWDEYGLRISIPHDTLSSTETSELAVTALIGGQFVLPVDTELISIVYGISVSKPLLKPIKLEIQHCAHLVTEDHTSYLSFATASINQPVLPYQFQLEEGGEFRPRDQYGSISLSQFSLKSIIKSLTRPFRRLLGYDDTSSHKSTLASQDNSEQENNGSISDYDEEIIEGTSELPTVGDVQTTEANSDISANVVISSSTLSNFTHLAQPTLTHSFTTPNEQSAITSPVQDQSPVNSSSPDNMYVGQVVYEVKQHNSEWLMRFMVAKHLNALLEFIKTSLPSNVERDSLLSFAFQDNNGHIELVLNEEQEYPFNGWSFCPHIHPTQISKTEVDKFGVQSLPSFPTLLITISVDHSPSTVSRIQYRVPLKGIEPNDKNICIVRSYFKNTDGNGGILSTHQTEGDNSSIPSSQCHNIKDVFRTHFADLTSLVSVSIHRLSIVPKLYSARLISEQCFDEVVDNSSKTDAEKGLALMRALKSSIHSQPLLFKTLVTILEKVEAFVPLAKKLKHDCPGL